MDHLREGVDRVVAYEGALKLQQPWKTEEPLVEPEERISFLTAATRLVPFDAGGISLTPVRPPTALGSGWAAEGVTTRERGGLELRLTSPERTVVDLLDRIALGPGPAGLWESFLFGGLDPAAMVRHALALESAIVAARLGLFLEHVPGVQPGHLAALERARPSSPAYFDRARHKGRGAFARHWNLVVPVRLHHLLRRTDFRGRTPVLPRPTELPD